jgi:hypothetical protein
VTPSSRVAIRDVTVIDPSRRAIIPAQTVVTEGSDVVLGDSADVPVPAGAEIIDGRGRFVMPGLWDMHVHGATDDLGLFLACGVTGLREMGPAPDAVTARADIATGRVLGPRLVVGDPVDGAESVIDWVTPAEDADAARAAVTKARVAGNDFVKVFSFLPRDAFFGISMEAQRQAIRFAGHVPYSVTSAEAAEAGQWTIEHLTGVLHGGSRHELDLLSEFAAIRRPASSLFDWVRLWWFRQSRDLVESQDAARRHRLLALFADRGTWHVPTLITLRDFAHFDALPHADDPRRRWVSPDWANRAFFAELATDFERTVTADERHHARAAYALQLRVVNEMHQAGVGLLSGTDCAPSRPPGLGVHEELALFVEAGLSTMDALRTATTNPAAALGLDRAGRVETGAIADLVVLDADPIADIRNTERVHAVIANGRLLDAAAIEGLVAQHRAVAASAWAG